MTSPISLFPMCYPLDSKSEQNCASFEAPPRRSRQNQQNDLVPMTFFSGLVKRGLCSGEPHGAGVRSILSDQKLLRRFLLHCLARGQIFVILSERHPRSRPCRGSCGRTTCGGSGYPANATFFPGESREKQTRSVRSYIVYGATGTSRSSEVAQSKGLELPVT